ncbi:hypothetical protein BKA93DRAFT_691986, partial [Sparassis latifolia]
MSLVLWIAWFKRDNPHVNFVDDNSVFDHIGDVLWYERYQAYLPTGQVKPLLLWDELGLPHKWAKQTHGAPHPYIGIDIDPNAMTATLPPTAKQKLLKELTHFCDVPGGHRRRTLKEFQVLAGYVNWAFNVYPLLRPALCNLYAKMSGKKNPHSGIYVNSRVVADLQWMIKHVETSSGVHFLGATHW